MIDGLTSYSGVVVATSPFHLVYEMLTIEGGWWHMATLTGGFDFEHAASY